MKLLTSIENWHAAVGEATIDGVILAGLTHHEYQARLEGESTRKKLGHASLKSAPRQQPVIRLTCNPFTTE